MAKQQELKSIIAVYGKTDSSLDALTRKIEQIGETAGQVGGALTDLAAPAMRFIKQSLPLYTDYDDILRRIEAAGDYNEKQMKVVDAAAREAGATTRYMASDAAEAFLSLTQAGVSLDNSLSTLPTLLDAAAAGNMDLADASDLLISNVYSLGKAFEENDVTAYMDKVVTAADATNTNVKEMMEGVSKVGAAGRLFAGGDDELLAFMGMLANLNMKGTTGGVNARNMIISLLAPTNKAATLMEALEISETELEDSLADIDLTDSAAAMKKLGLETTDTEGRVRPMVDILTDLKSATDELADDEKATVLYSMFGKRTYPAVAGLLELLDQYPELLDEIGNSAGATARKADKLEGGIGGSTRMLKSAFEELQITVGEAVNDKAMEWMGTARDFLLDSAEFIKGLDTDKVNGFLDALATVAVSGAGLTIANGAIGTLTGILKNAATPGGALLLGATALLALGTAIGNAQDAAARKDLEEHFGTLELDSEKLSGWVSTLASDYESAAAGINAYADAISGAAENYESYVQQFSGGILEAYLTGTTLNQADKDALNSYVTAMVDEVRTAAGQQKLQLDDIIQITYNGENQGDEEKASAWSGAIDGLFGALDKDAQEAGQNLMQVYLDAAADGVIDADEKTLIAEAQAKLNSVMAEIESIQSDIDWNTAYARAMNIGHESWKDGLDIIDATTQESNAQTQANFEKMMGMVLTYEQRGMAIPQSMLDAYGLEQGDYAGWKAGIAGDERDQKLDNNLRRDVAAANMADLGFDTYAENKAGVALSSFDGIVQGIIDGTMTLDDAFAQADEIIGDMSYGKAKDTAKGLENLMQEISTALPFDELVAQIERQKETKGEVDNALVELYKDYMKVGLLNGYMKDDSQFGLTKAYGENEVYMGGNLISENGSLALNIGMPDDAEEKTTEYLGKVSSVIEQSDMQVNANLPEGSEKANSFMTDVQSAFDSGNVVLNVVLSAIGGKRNTDGKKLTKYAEGGYADEPSIFGEDGGEWAIPEEKTEHSRILLRRAAAGSGFAPEEIYPEKKSEKTGMQFTFAPTIYAQNASGVKEALERERADVMKMMDDWYNEKMRENERVSFA